MTKPLGMKSYGSIGHLPESRMGAGDHHVSASQAAIATTKARDRHDWICVEEKLDGSCCAVARVKGELLALGRAGYLAQTSQYEQHQLFAAWVREHEYLFAFLEEGERVVGEWLAQAHSTRYDLNFGEQTPLVAFDIMRGHERAPRSEFWARLADTDLATPHVIHVGSPLQVAPAMATLGTYGFHGALDPVEGVVWRVEHRGKVDFLAKFVRPDKVDGLYLEKGAPIVWNWRP